MRNKQNKPKRGKATQIQKLETQLRKSRPFRDTGGIIGKSIGNLFGVDGSSIGKWLGSGIGSIFGSGDYTITGQAPAYNVLTSGSQTPKFSSDQRTNVVCHREYLGDINGTASFNAGAYPLNPGSTTTFPWLATLAQNYQEYRFHGLVFEFRPLITDFIASGSPGVVVMATNYNADAPTFTSKQQMENSEFATSVKPTIGLMHAIECATSETILPQRYVRSGEVPFGQDLRLYDHGIFQFATQGNPLVGLGELWVTYCVEFFKPVLPRTVGGQVESQHIIRSSTSSANPFGLVGVYNIGTMGVTVNTNSFAFRASPGQKYLVNFNWYGTDVPVGDPTFVVTNGNLLPYLRGNTDIRNLAPGPSTASKLIVEIIVNCTAITTSIVTVAMNIGQVVPQNLEIFITELDSSITA